MPAALMSQAPCAGNHGQVAVVAAVLVVGRGDFLRLLPQGFLSVWHPQGEHPINPSMFVL